MGTPTESLSRHKEGTIVHIKKLRVSKPHAGRSHHRRKDLTLEAGTLPVVDVMESMRH